MRIMDADKFRVFLDRQYHNCHGYMGNKKEIYREALRAVKSYVHSEGQIDAVEVVRCGECKFYREKYNKCILYGERKSDNFCSYGKRRKVSE